MRGGGVRDAILNNPRVFILTKHGFISTQLLNLTCATCFDLYLGHPQGRQYKNLTKKNTIKTQRALFRITIFIMLKHKAHNMKVQQRRSFTDVYIQRLLPD